MPKSIELKILERQLKLAQLELARIEVRGQPTPDELGESEYLPHTLVHQGPEYLEIRARIWTEPYVSIEGRAFKNLAEARALAEREGYAGISLNWR